MRGRGCGVVGPQLEPEFRLAQLRRRVDPQAAAAGTEGFIAAVRLEVLQPEQVAIERPGVVEPMRRRLGRDIAAALEVGPCWQR
jgi:hypothetical protein